MPINLKRYTETHRYRYVPVSEEKWYALRYDTNNLELDAKVRRCFFIGYEDKQFGYRSWDNQNRKIIRSKNVVFDEKVLYKDKSSGDLEGTV